MPVEMREEDGAEAVDTSSWEGFRISLEGQRGELLSELKHFPPSTSREALDFPSIARRRFLERMVANIDEALARIADGTYGACLTCGRAIPIETLRAEPVASHCPGCVTARRADRPWTAQPVGYPTSRMPSHTRAHRQSLRGTRRIPPERDHLCRYRSLPHHFSIV
jgi:DnaK suppressor protein